MRPGLILLSLASFIVFSNTLSATPIAHLADNEHQRWLEDKVREAKSIKVGMSQGDLLKIFSAESGLQTKPPTRYTLKSCPMIHIEVTFGIHQRKALRNLWISNISPLYLDYVASD